jgi:MYXO-CTERM domain-containing protein
MGVFYQANVTGSGFSNPPLFSFTGTSGIEQTPEPSHTALPVGIAAGLLVLRRRRVIR